VKRRNLPPIIEDTSSKNLVKKLFQYQKYYLPSHCSPGKWRYDIKVVWSRLLKLIRRYGRNAEAHYNKDKDYIDKVRMIRQLMYSYIYKIKHRVSFEKIPTNSTVFSVLENITSKGFFPTIADKNLGILLDMEAGFHGSLFIKLIDSSAFITLDYSKEKVKMLHIEGYNNAVNLFESWVCNQHDRNYYAFYYQRMKYMHLEINIDPDGDYTYPNYHIRPIVKIHKVPWKMRPIIANTTTPLKMLGLCMAGILKKWVLLVCKTLGNNTPILYDTFDFIKRLEQIQSRFYNSVQYYVIDVESYYPSIPTKELWENIKWIKDWLVLMNPQEDPAKIETEYIFCKVAGEILHSVCIIELQYGFIRQKQGLLMGNSESPHLAQLYLLKYEIEALHNWYEKDKILSDHQGLITMRYMDDIFVIPTVPYRMDRLKIAIRMKYLGSKQDFTFNWKPGKFLDVRISRHWNTNLVLLREHNSIYINYKSQVPSFMKRNVPLTLCKRALMFCSTNFDFWINTRIIAFKLLEQGWSGAFIRKRGLILKYEQRRKEWKKLLIKRKNILDKVNLYSSPFIMKTKFPNAREQERDFNHQNNFASRRWVTIKYNHFFDNMIELRSIEKLCKTLPEPIRFSYALPPNLKDCVRLFFDRAMEMHPLLYNEQPFGKNYIEQEIERKRYILDTQIGSIVVIPSHRDEEEEKAEIETVVPSNVLTSVKFFNTIPIPK